MKKTMLSSVITILMMVNTSSVHAQVLAGTDGLGRTLVQNDAVGDRKTGRHVAMFYFLWQGDKGSPTSPKYWDLTKIFATHPEVGDDFNNPNWGGGLGSYYFWGESVYGYYAGDDYWVHLRNIQLLTDADVDFLVIDATNRITYPVQSEALMKAMDAVRAQGKTPPRIVYYTNTRSGETIQEIYEQFYREGAPYRHPDCWFYLDGKPLIIGASKDVNDRRCLDFFTIREAQWPNEPKRVDGWPWISFTRDPEVYFNHRGEREIINVSVAQHPSPFPGMGGSAFYGFKGNWGRSYRNNSPGNPETDIVFGYNIQEQWEVALREDVPFIFITGWNEWIAGRWKTQDNNPQRSFFCDSASPEFSRDLEPSLTAGLNDHYYMQLVNNVRRYKGIGKMSAVSPLQKPVRNINDWAAVDAVYVDYTGDAAHRNHPGAQTEPLVTYTNTTGRNDFHIMKVAHHKDKLYFYAETVDDITPNTGDNWMRLYMDTDRNFQTGWNGYDYRIIGGATLQRYVDGHWESVNQKGCKYNVSKNKMMITVPVSALNIDPGTLNFEFKWTDNMQVEDPMDWYVNGDAAPGGRFNYIFSEKSSESCPDGRSEPNTFTLWQLPSQINTIGNSYILLTQNGKVVVMDGGVKEETPYLRGFIAALGNEVEAWFVSHPHADHIGALFEILNDPRDIVIHKVYQSAFTPAFRNTEPGSAASANAFYDALEASGISVINYTAPGSQIAIDGVNFKILAVTNEDIPVNPYNNSCMVVRVWDEQKSILFLGDLGEEAGDRLLNSDFRKDLDCDYVQMAHHGQQGVSREFYRAIRFSACLWPTPSWVYNNDVGGGFDTHILKTIEIRELMKELGITEQYFSFEGLCRIR